MLGQQFNTFHNDSWMHLTVNGEWLLNVAVLPQKQINCLCSTTPFLNRNCALAPNMADITGDPHLYTVPTNEYSQKGCSVTLGVKDNSVLGIFVSQMSLFHIRFTEGTGFDRCLSKCYNNTYNINNSTEAKVTIEVTSAMIFNR